MIPFWVWCKVAQTKPQVVLIDGSIGTLLTVRKSDTVMKVKRYNRHEQVAYNDVHAIVSPSGSYVRLPSWQPFSWAQRGEPGHRLSVEYRPDILPEVLVLDTTVQIREQFPAVK